MKKVLVIVGPTAVGKTSLGIQLAKKYNGEIINGDSMQVYRELDIGTAKVTEAEKEGITHYLMDCCDKQEAFNVADFQKKARACIDAIVAKGKLPIIVGGTGLYIQGLLYDYQFGANEQTETLNLREKYQQFAQKNGKHALWELLKERDPLAASKIHANNLRKVIRALEVVETTGQSILAPKTTPDPCYDYYLIGLNTDRELLYERINQRVDLMMVAGLEKEARLLEDIPDSQAAHGIGYKEFFPYFKGETSKEAVVTNIKKNSRHYAKRQLTWFRNRLTAHWFNLIEHPEEIQRLEEEIQKWKESSRDR